MTKDILMQNWDDIVTDKSLTLARAEAHLNNMNRSPDVSFLNERFLIIATSGSSGTRGVFAFNEDEYIEKHLAWIRHIRYVKNKRQQTSHNNDKKIKIAQIIMENPVYGMYAMARIFTYDDTERHYFPVSMPLADIITGLHATQPDVLSAVPSTVYRLCREAEKNKLFIHPAVVTLSAEPLYAPIRALIKKVWPAARIYNAYGCTEGLSAVNCQANSLEMHLNADNCIIEPVDQYNYPIRKGMLSDKIILTNLYNFTQPLIRYELFDQLKFLNKSCPCGIAHPLIAEPTGRPEFDFFYEDNVFVHHLVFVTIFLLNQSIREYQVEQTVSGVDIKLVSTGWINKFTMKRMIVKKLKALGLKNPKITISLVPMIPYLPSGKIRRFIPLERGLS